VWGWGLGGTSSTENSRGAISGGGLNRAIPRWTAGETRGGGTERPQAPRICMPSKPGARPSLPRCLALRSADRRCYSPETGGDDIPIPPYTPTQLPPPPPSQSSKPTPAPSGKKSCCTVGRRNNSRRRGLWGEEGGEWGVGGGGRHGRGMIAHRSPTPDRVKRCGG
jgi:hypothetical protein